MQISEKKTKLFIENFIIYGLSGAFSKLIPFVMIPIITRMMPSEAYYGLSDLTNTLVSIAGIIAMSGIYDGLFRMYFEKDDLDYKIATCSTALFFSLILSLIVFFILLLFKNPISLLFFGDGRYSYLVIIASFTVLFGASNLLVAAPTRLQNNRKVYLAANIFFPTLSYGIAIALLLRGYYTLALPVAALITGLTIEFFYYFLNRRWFRLSHFSVVSLKQMLMIGLPLVPNFLIYWIFNSSDRIMITNFLGLGEAGIYSVGSKLGHASQLIYSAFAGGWSYFVFSTMRDDNQVRYNSKIFELMAMISFLSMGVACLLSQKTYEVLFTGEYISGYIVAPYLFLCPLLLMLFQISSSQFIIVKKTWYSSLGLFLGAITNVILNQVLIPVLGIEGAAIATLCGYVFSLSFCLIILVKLKLFFVGFRFLFGSLVSILHIMIWRNYCHTFSFYSLFQFIVFAGSILLLYKNELGKMFVWIKDRKME